MAMIHFNTDQRHKYEPFVFDSIQQKIGGVVWEVKRPLMFDIGAYDGITSVLLAEIAGPGNVVIVEPADVNWATIKAYWNAHKLPPPAATFWGFMGAPMEGRSPADSVGKAKINMRDFPEEAYWWPVSEGEERLRFRALESNVGVPVMRVDAMTRYIGPPLGLCVDVEGAEYEVLTGAISTLCYNRPYVWVSIHPEYMKERFNREARDLHTFMRCRNYVSTLLGTDQEEHWLFEPEEKPWL